MDRSSQGWGDRLYPSFIIPIQYFNWTKGTVTFNFLCNNKFGSPGPLELYIVSDFGKLRDCATEGSNPIDVTTLWNLINGKTPVGSVEAKGNKWNSISIAEGDIAAGKDLNGNISFILKIEDESIEEGNAYTIGTKEGSRAAYLTWKPE